MGARFENDHLKRGPHSALQEMTAVGGTVRFADHHMGVQHWLAILFHDVARKGKGFHLLFYWNLPIAFLLSIEEPKRDFTESANGCDLCSSKAVLSGKPHQRFLGFFVFIEYERECLQAIFVQQQFRLHIDVISVKSHAQQNADADKSYCNPVARYNRETSGSRL